MTMKVKAKQLTYEDFGNRITHTNEQGTTTSRVISGVKTSLEETHIKNHVPEGAKPFIAARYMVTVITFLDGSNLAVPGDSMVELDEDTTSMEFQVYYPNQTGLR